MSQLRLLRIFSTLASAAAFRRHHYRRHRPTRRIMSAEPAACSAAKRCVPCESLDKSHLLTEQQVANEMAEMKLWRIDGGKIVREYTAKNFQAAMDSLNAVGVIAERENHHPDFHLTEYRNVRIELYTHSLGGLSQNDLSLAKMLDEEVNVSYSPKWLKSQATSHPEAGK